MRKFVPDNVVPERLRKELLDLERRLDNVLVQVEGHIPTGDEEIDRDFRAQLQARFADLARTRRTKAEEAAAWAVNGGLGGDLELLNKSSNLAALDEELQRKLFDAFNLELRYSGDTDEVLIRVTLGNCPE
ncbi:hypothetical protein [Nonomuraea recticatena]|uniref:hypothetical protein n=1 Tax=Nonomuraea recticatena TaxID=46178 RepID=UPI003611DAF5